MCVESLRCRRHWPLATLTSEAFMGLGLGGQLLPTPTIAQQLLHHSQVSGLSSGLLLYVQHQGEGRCQSLRCPCSRQDWLGVNHDASQRRVVLAASANRPGTRSGPNAVDPCEEASTRCGGTAGNGSSNFSADIWDLGLAHWRRRHKATFLFACDLPAK
jgi:hypothetical protein